MKGDRKININEYFQALLGHLDCTLDVRAGKNIDG